jgi:hypothetical protein
MRGGGLRDAEMRSSSHAEARGHGENGNHHSNDNDNGSFHAEIAENGRGRGARRTDLAARPSKHLTSWMERSGARADAARPDREPWLCSAAPRASAPPRENTLR